MHNGTGPTNRDCPLLPHHTDVTTSKNNWTYPINHPPFTNTARGAWTSPLSLPPTGSSLEHFSPVFGDQNYGGDGHQLLETSQSTRQTAQQNVPQTTVFRLDQQREVLCLGVCRMEAFETMFNDPSTHFSVTTRRPACSPSSWNTIKHPFSIGSCHEFHLFSQRSINNQKARHSIDGWFLYDSCVGHVCGTTDPIGKKIATTLYPCVCWQQPPTIDLLRRKKAGHDCKMESMHGTLLCEAVEPVFRTRVAVGSVYFWVPVAVATAPNMGHGRDTEAARYGMQRCKQPKQLLGRILGTWKTVEMCSRGCVVHHIDTDTDTVLTLLTHDTQHTERRHAISFNRLPTTLIII